MIIPNAEYAVVEIQKLRNYCLSSTHPRGRHKARVFASALGITDNDAELLRNALLDAVCHFEAELAEQDPYGQRYVLDFMMQGPSGSAQVRSAWIIRTEEDFPRLTSCYVVV